MSYISELQIDNGTIQPIGSSLYGTCATPAAASNKIVNLTSFDTLVHGTTIHVKFLNGNTAPLDNFLTLAVGSTLAQQITNPGGNINWSAGKVVSFTYDDTEHNWIVNDSDNANMSVTVDQSYNSDSPNPISGVGVADALNDLGAAAEKDIITNIIETGVNANKNSDDLPTTAAVTDYVDRKTVGITGAMHFVGRTTTSMSDGSEASPIIINGNSYIPNSGDVVLSGDHQEYIWVETNTSTHEGYWKLLGDEGSYALKSSTDSVIATATFTSNVPSELVIKETQVPNVVSTGTATNMSVENGVLKITIGHAPELGTAITINEVGTWKKGTAASLITTARTVIVPTTT